MPLSTIPQNGILSMDENSVSIDELALKHELLLTGFNFIEIFS